MDPDTRSLVAVIVAVCALLVVGFAAGVTLLAIRSTRGAITARGRVTALTSDLRRDAPGVRARIEQSAIRVDRLREQWAATDQAVTDLTGSLTSLRGSLQRLTRGRLAMLIRGAGIVSKAAQVALLWR